MLVTPLRDGMNLVAKEYVACAGRRDRRARARASSRARHASCAAPILVNPHDLDGIKDAIRHVTRPRPESRPGRGCAASAASCAATTCTAGPGSSLPPCTCRRRLGRFPQIGFEPFARGEWWSSQIRETPSAGVRRPSFDKSQGGNRCNDRDSVRYLPRPHSLTAAVVPLFAGPAGAATGCNAGEFPASSRRSRD